MLKEKRFDVVIIGAGPAGVACALSLKNSGLQVAVIDKAKFPRDKICGDAIPGKAWKVLKNILPESIEELKSLPSYKEVKSTIINFDKVALGDIFWVNKAVNIKRLEFDNYLFEKILNCDNIEVFQETKISSFKEEQGFELITSNEEVFRCKLLVAADGANSPTVKSLSKITHRNSKYVSVRTYFENLDFDSSKNYAYSRKGLPGYFWIFPVGSNQFNVGIGYDTEVIPKGKSSKEVINDFISGDSDLKQRFSKGRELQSVKGHKLPIGGRKQRYAQDGFLPIGDAAFLVDPMYGHGIDKALQSGQIAGGVIEDAFKQNDFSEQYLTKYDQLIHKELFPELQKSTYNKIILTKFPFLLKLLYPVAILFDKRFKKATKY